ncbi:transglycosylase SLT domain-containing protein [Mycolicibacterium sp. 120270]|uniref:lytic transglycosylase domain-containing protein n=1 Tax=Mycolicibacterium sp. 120270 TaxID=3090600 RepID=UPI00299EFF28|nr:transglycosylase SLT domain-containing protein [Mycolicibacterium sp. 120270]MDX1882181.1 transglycosylase SLT domain-containing protein [Mycolicibacterium sp. 120270]
MTSRRSIVAILVALGFAVVGCSHDAPPAQTAAPSATPTSVAPQPSPTVALLDDETAPAGAQPRLAQDPAQLADDLVADEQTLRNAATPEAGLREAARRQQAAYRAIGYHLDWDAITRPRIPPELLGVYDLNVDARRQLTSLAEVRDTIPAWRIIAPAPADELMAYYREAEAASGVGWNYLAAINFIETRLGSVVGPSSAGAQGPMQFLPSTFAAYGDGTDIYAPRDSIMAAGRYLAANNFAGNRDSAIYRYNHDSRYVQAVNDYAAVLAADPAAFTGYYRWEVYLKTPDGDLLLPIGYASDTPVSVREYLATHPQ